jgi:hypothetical protein
MFAKVTRIAGFGDRPSAGSPARPASGARLTVNGEQRHHALPVLRSR